MRVDVIHGDADKERREQEDRREVDRARPAKRESPRAPRQLRPIPDVQLEVAPAVADEVVADVRAWRADSAGFHDLPGAVDGFQGDADLRFTRRRRQLFDRLADAVAAEKVHRAVRAGRIPLEHVFDEAD